MWDLDAIHHNAIFTVTCGSLPINGMAIHLVTCGNTNGNGSAIHPLTCGSYAPICAL